MGLSSKPSANPAWLSVLQMEHEHVPSGILKIRSVTLHLAWQDFQVWPSGEYLEAAGNLLDWVILFLVDWWPFVRNSLHHSLHNIYLQYIRIYTCLQLFHHFVEPPFTMSVPIIVFLSSLGSRYEQSASLQFSSLESWSTDTCTAESLRCDSWKLPSRHDVFGEAGYSRGKKTAWWLSWPNEKVRKNIFGHGYFQMLMAAKWFDPTWPDLPVLVDSYDFRSP